MSALSLALEGTVKGQFPRAVDVIAAVEGWANEPLNHDGAAAASGASRAGPLSKRERALDVRAVTTPRGVVDESVHRLCRSPRAHSVVDSPASRRRVLVMRVPERNDQPVGEDGVAGVEGVKDSGDLDDRLSGETVIQWVGLL